jgi:MYXO-CTERM domain-containing protein
MLVTSLVWTFGSAPAAAELEACGGIFLSGDAGCEYRPKEECMTECKTVAVEQSCVAEVYNECETSCTTTASTECENTCTTSCVDTCTTTSVTTNPPSCIDLCLADCDTDGSGACGGSKHRGACGRCAKHTCAKKCEARCGDSPEPEKVTTVTECMPTCTEACSASCTAKVNTQCQVDCQERSYVQCEQKMVERCETECTQKGGAIFCDGQFVNASNASSCADELLAKIDIEVDIDIDVDVEEAGNDAADTAGDVGDSVDEKVSDACAVTRVGGHGAAGGIVALPLLVLALARSRRRRARTGRAL